MDGQKLHQELKVSEISGEGGDANSILVEANDSVEAVNVTKLIKDQKLVEIENNSQKPFRFKLGKNKLPQVKLATNSKTTNNKKESIRLIDFQNRQLRSL